MQTAKTYIASNEIEVDYSRNTSILHRKKFAQFFTPYQIADLMTEWLLGNAELKNVLEPAFGLGIFSRILLNKKSDITITGFETDSSIFQKAQNIFAGEANVNLQLRDYIYSDWNDKYDGIICNPPYFKFHDYDNENALKELEKQISWKLNGFTNLYAVFLLKSLNQLKKNGRAAYIVPSEFLNSDYGKLVKAYFIKNKFLRHIVVIDFNENVFDDALTTASILLFANDNKADSVQFSTVRSLSDLIQIERLITDYPTNLIVNQSVEFDKLDCEIKWRGYYQKQNSLKYKHLVPFSNYGKVVRGIATGANDYFVFNQSKADEYEIQDRYLLPCICKAADVKKSFFTKEDFDCLQKNDRSVFLLNAVKPIDSSVEDYLEKGLANEIDKKYLTASRKVWYLPENRLPAPIWVSVFNRNGLRFIRNEANISNLTTFHCIYLNLFSLTKIDLLFAYLLTDVSRRIFEDNRREYGNGLQKFEPNDINKANMLNLELINTSGEKEILEIYTQYRQSVIQRIADESLIEKIDKIFIDIFSL